MAYMNGYFQLQTSEQGVSLLLSPPIGGGERIRVAELKEYLNSVGVPYDVKAINSALLSMGEEKVVLFLAPMKIPPCLHALDLLHPRKLSIEYPNVISHFRLHLL